MQTQDVRKEINFTTNHTNLLLEKPFLPSDSMKLRRIMRVLRQISEWGFVVVPKVRFVWFVVNYLKIDFRGFEWADSRTGEV